MNYPAWAAESFSTMKMNGITGGQLAEEMGVTKGYVSMLLTGKRIPDDAEERVKGAIDRILTRRKLKQ